MTARDAAAAADDIATYMKASEAVTNAQMAFDRARADHDLVHSGRSLTAEEQYRVLMNAQRDTRRVSPAAAVALQDYVANSDRINAALRDPELLARDQRTQQQVREISRVLSRSKAAEDLTVYRVVPIDATDRGRAFRSTTLDPQFALNFQKQFGDRPTRILKMTVKAGSRALFVNNIFEREVLLAGEDNHPSEEWTPTGG